MIMNQHFRQRDKDSMSWRPRLKRNAYSSRRILIKALIENFLTDYQRVIIFSKKKSETQATKNDFFCLIDRNTNLNG